MQRRIHGWPVRWALPLISMLPVFIGGVWLLAADGQKGGNRLAGSEIEWVEVRRTDLDTTLMAGGDLQPTKETIVTCQVEDITDSEGSMIISMVENGTPVKKGDELCRLDSSELEELARQQEIVVNRARSTSIQARLRLETAQIAIREYRDGLVIQQTKEFEGRIALGRADRQKMRDHLDWTERMVAKGYASRRSSQASGRPSHRPSMICGRPKGNLTCSAGFRSRKRSSGCRARSASPSTINSSRTPDSRPNPKILPTSASRSIAASSGRLRMESPSTR